MGRRQISAVFEVNALVWAREWSARLGRTVGLDSLPPEAWDEVCRPGIDAVWLMGVWERSPAGIAIGRTDPVLEAAHREALADYTEDDVVGSPYCVRRYDPDPALGGSEGLAAARAELARRGCRLVLDFVPNHVAPDHPWVRSEPWFFVAGGAEDHARDPDAWLEVDGHHLARGRDPYFPPWPDVVQVNAFSPALREAAVETLRDLADRCDAVRCDMAMLMLNEVFTRTWGHVVGAAPATEYWTDVIGGVHETHPDLLFLAEAYWDLEWRLVELGFDACYDKRLYDRLRTGDLDGIRAHLGAPVDGQRHVVRFTENHDEPRAAASLGPAARAAAVVIATTPGTTLWHEGQAEAHRVRLPVLLGRRPTEPDDAGSADVHHALWAAAPRVRRGTFALAETRGWPDDETHRQLLAWTWTDGADVALVVVNYADAPAAGRVRLPGVATGEGDGDDRTWTFTDLLSGDRFDRAGAELSAEGLFVALEPWACHVLTTTRPDTDPTGGTTRG